MSGSPTIPSPSTSVVSTVRAYAIPLILLAGAMLFQLVLIPNASPPSHYDVLQIERYSSIETVQEAYNNLESKWSMKNSDAEASDIREFMKIRYAYELLTNRLWKRDYDRFGIDEQFHVLESAIKLKNISQLNLDFPLLHSPSGSVDHSSSKEISASDFGSMFPDSKPWIIQLYSSGSNRCVEFSKPWNQIASLLDGVANSGVMELGEIENENDLAVFLADRSSTGKPLFRKGLPLIVAIPPGCVSAKCFSRFDGELTVDTVTDWFATTILALPQINYYSMGTLVPNFLGKSSHHKVKVIFFSETGDRAAPFIRQAVKDYWGYASFANILWREEDSSYWLGAFGVQSAPALVFLKDPGVKPVVHHGSVNDTLFLNMMEDNKKQELPQLRSATSMELGCDPRGYSRAGFDTTIWYCAVAVGRPSLELNKLRETMCRVQEKLSVNQSLAPAVDALKRKRLTFAWLDGEKEKDYCRFYLGSTGSEHTCGQRRDMTDTPRLFVVRYMRNSSALDNRKQEMAKWKTKISLVQDLIDDSDQAGQFVAGYKGAVDDVSQINEWLTNIIQYGDSRDLPFFLLSTPKLVPDDDTEAVWSKPSPVAPLKNLKQSILGVLSGLSVYREDPRIGPTLLLGALISWGTIWLRRSQRVQPSQSNQPSQPSS
ncbi:uncharacterized protein LOC130713583 [Lotus japonicus]|uniref:uncharacterized protein LOC130713583 n=1 Tax=Lotus japonicus TaxID=34305 RepID=UPI0025825D31|nr:uncharacterized protein LOC130713583 [Lotus japonicus]